jgi:hypothetical protein
MLEKFSTKYRILWTTKRHMQAVDQQFKDFGSDDYAP